MPDKRLPDKSAWKEFADDRASRETGPSENQANCAGTS